MTVDLTETEVAFLLAVLGNLSIKPTAKDAVQITMLVQSVLGKISPE